MNSNQPIVSIVIRARNEEKWLPRCLAMVYSQTYKNFEVVLVDNNSLDNTQEIAHEWNVDKVLDIKNYSPGAALNLGIKNSSGKYIVILSAHCVPCDDTWLGKLVSIFQTKSEIFATYGRQVPLPLTSGVNTRDLLSIFRSESRIQYSDYFFHNANSAIRREAWEEIPFNEELKNLEDQEWAKAHLKKGTKQIFYNSEARVFHHDGLHFFQSEQRTQGVVQVLKELNISNNLDYPIFHHHRLKSWVSVVLFDENRNKNSLKSCVENYRNFISLFSANTNKGKSVLVSSKNFYENLISDLNVDLSSTIYFIERKFNDFTFSSNEDILKVLASVVRILPEKLRFHPEAVFYFNPQYQPTTKKNFSNLISNYFLGDLDLVFLGRKISGLTWIKTPSGEFKPTDSVLNPNTERDHVFEAFLGAGSVFSASSLIRTEILKSTSIRIIDVGESIQRLKIDDSQ